MREGKGDLYKFISKTGLGSEAYLFFLFIILLIGLLQRFAKWDSVRHKGCYVVLPMVV